MKRAIFVSIGTVAGLTAALRYTPEAQTLGGSNLAFGGLGESLNTSPSPTASQDSGTPTPVPSVSASTVVSQSPKAVAKPSSTITPVSSPSPHTKSKTTTHGVVKSTPKPTPKKTHKPKPTSTVFTGSVSPARPYGVVQVQIKVENHKVTQIAALQAPDGDQQSYNISVQAIPMLVQEALAAQSANIANISGASHTCEAFKASLAAALQQAGL